MSKLTKDKDTKRFCPSLCVTHYCNLNCVYCYQKHDVHNRMSLETAKKCIDWIFDNVPPDFEEVEIGFIGGEPLVEFELLKQVFFYTIAKKPKQKIVFFATTNGTLLDEEKKKWFSDHKQFFVLGLSLDGTPETHNHNRSNSFDKIDIDFFKKTWPFQGVKMTLTEYSLEHLAENIKYIHSLGIDEIGGVNLFEGIFDWSQEKYIKILIPQLEELVDFYVEHDELNLNQMLNKHLSICEAKEKQKRKWCGIGTGTIFFDIDGTKLPCPFCTPMTFNKEDLDTICKTDFTNNSLFVDDDCFNNCYIYPICPNCSGANYLTQKCFSKRDKSKCRIQKLIALFTAELTARRMIKHPERYEDYEKLSTINAIKKIKELFLPEFKEYIDK